MRKFYRLTVWLTALLLLLGVSSAYAGGSAEEYVRAQHGELVTLLSQPKTSSRDQKISAIMDRVFDYEELARRSLGDDWNALTDPQRSEFKELLEQLVRQSYRRHLDKTNGWNLNYEKSSSVDGGVRVPTVASHRTDKRKEPVSIDYLMHETKGQWRVFDIVVEGSSLISNYQSQFRKIIRKKGFAELIGRMKRRIAKGTD
jgi:phospholipid transport system substrate-binding protein